MPRDNLCGYFLFAHPTRDAIDPRRNAFRPLRNSHAEFAHPAGKDDPKWARSRRSVIDDAGRRIAIALLFSLAKGFAAECHGTGLLVATVVGSGIMGEKLAGGNVALALLGKCESDVKPARRLL